MSLSGGRRRAARGIAVLAGLWQLAAAADTSELDRLMALLAQRGHRTAHFEQEQYLAVLKRPAHSTGELRYDAPDHLEQRTLEPRAQSAVLDHGVLTLQIGTRERQLRLQDYPQLAPVLEGVLATLAGNRGALERLFRLEFQGDVDHWRLLLLPLDAGLAASVLQIRLAGERDAILQVEVQQRNGDRSVMSIAPRE
jgi:hypothetical protein